MIYRVIFHPKAEKEWLESVIWYEKISPGLGDDFRKETEKVIHHLQIHPFIYEKKKTHFREAVLRKFHL